MTLTSSDLERIKAVSIAISEGDWERLKSLSESAIPNFDVFLQYIDSFGEQLLPLIDGFEKNIRSVELPSGDMVFEVPMRTEGDDASDIMLVISKSKLQKDGLLNVDYIYRS